MAGNAKSGRKPKVKRGPKPKIEMNASEASSTGLHFPKKDGYHVKALSLECGLCEGRIERFDEKKDSVKSCKKDCCETSCETYPRLN